MNYKKRVISLKGQDTYSTNTYSRLASTIAGLDDEITVDVNNNTSIIFRNKFKLKFEMGTYTNTFAMSMIYGDQTTEISRTITFGNIVISLAKNEECIDFKIRLSGTSAPYFNFNVLMFTFANLDAWAFAYNAGTTARPFATTQALKNANDNVNIGIALNRFPYVYNSQSTSFDLLNNKLFVSNGLITATATTLFDTSTLVGDQLYPIGTKVFYAIDDNTLMEVDDIENQS